MLARIHIEKEGCKRTENLSLRIQNTCYLSKTALLARLMLLYMLYSNGILTGCSPRPIPCSLQVEWRLLRICS